MMRVVVVCGLALCLAACVGAPADEETEEPTPHVHVRTATAVRGATEDVVQATGAVEALTVVRAAAPVAGRITLLTARPGDRVSEGDVVARVVPLETQAVLQGLAMLGGGDASAPSLRAPHTGEVAVRAPFSGVVSDRARNPGEQVAAGDVLLELVDPHALAVRAEVPLSDRARLRPGMPARLQSGPVTVDGRVVAALPGLVPPTLTAPVRIAVTTPGAPLPVHAPVRCTIVVARHRHALLVPRSAIMARTSSTGGAVMRVERGVARRRRVALRPVDGEAVRIVGGLRSGDVVVAEGGWGLPDGAAVVVEGSETP